MPDLTDRVSAAATWLFVPGDRPERFERAVGAAADMVVIDLEDAVTPEHKDGAREHVVAYLAQNPAVCVRINGADTPWHDDDLAALAGRVGAVMVPKAGDLDALEGVAERLGVVLVALIETAAGVLDARAVAAHPAVGRLAFGSYDLAAELHVSPDSWTALLRSRGELVLASAAAGLAPPVDGVTGAVRDVEQLDRDVRAAIELGFAGKLCVHPAQIEPAAALFRPSADELAWAERVLAAVRSASSGVVMLDGAMVDKPVADRAEWILSRSAGG